MSPETGEADPECSPKGCSPRGARSRRPPRHAQKSDQVKAGTARQSWTARRLDNRLAAWTRDPRRARCLMWGETHMRYGAFSFGSIRIDGVTYDHDVVI